MTNQLSPRSRKRRLSKTFPLSPAAEQRSSQKDPLRPAAAGGRLRRGVAGYGAAIQRPRSRTRRSPHQDGHRARRLEHGRYPAHRREVRHARAGRSYRPQRHEVSAQGAILHWNLSHFVVYESHNKKGVQIVDPGPGRRFVSWEAFGKAFSGIALVLDKTDTFQPLKKQGGNRLWAYFKALMSEKGSLGKVLTISVVLRIIAMATPILTALVVDRIVPRRDYSLLTVVAVAWARSSSST